jgi:hypothetical protein
MTKEHMMEKIVRDGRVAVAVSGGYGAGWSTWNSVDRAGWSTWNSVDPTDARFNQLFIDGKHEEAARLCDELDLGYSGGARGVEIEWIPLGTEFIIQEYDGAESLTTKDEFGWITA